MTKSRLLVVESETDSLFEGSRRCRVQGESVGEIRDELRACCADLGDIDDFVIEHWNGDAFVPLLHVDSLRSRDRVLLRTTARSGNAFPSLPGYLFPLNFAGGEFSIGGRSLVLQSQEGRAVEGTGHSFWDGAVVLAKFLEHAHAPQITGKRVLELGAGCGIVGMSAAALGAAEVVLTDLDYCAENLQNNVRLNALDGGKGGDAASSPVAVAVAELDWTSSADTLRRAFGGRRYDLLLASDVIWLQELVEPFISSVATLLHDCCAEGTWLLMSYQSRSKGVDEALMRHAKEYCLSVVEVPLSLHHPEFRSEIIHIYRVEAMRCDDCR